MPERPKEDREREERIRGEIIADAYGPDEQAISWYNHLSDTLVYPFSAVCRVRRLTSVLEVGDEVDVMGLAPDEVCEHEMFVMIQDRRPAGLAVPLAQLRVVHADDDGETRQAVEDWCYWYDRGYRF